MIKPAMAPDSLRLSCEDGSIFSSPSSTKR
jgi:hypothetical protein